MKTWPLPWPPTWVSWSGLAQHFSVGVVMTVIFTLLHTPPVAILLAAAIAGGSHELGDGDFQTAPGAPWNGIVDWLAFLPAPLIRMFF